MTITITAHDALLIAITGLVFYKFDVQFHAAVNSIKKFIANLFTPKP